MKKASVQNYQYRVNKLSKTVERPAQDSKPPTRELMEPHEWEELLRGFDEQEGQQGELNLANEEFWQKLSSTRWLTSPGEPASGER